MKVIPQTCGVSDEGYSTNTWCALN